MKALLELSLPESLKKVIQTAYIAQRDFSPDLRMNPKEAVRLFTDTRQWVEFESKSHHGPVSASRVLCRFLEVTDPFMAF